MKNSNDSHIQWRRSRLTCLIAASLTLPAGMIADAQARDYFNPALLELGSAGSGKADLSAFEEKDGQLPGTYRVDVYLNNEKVDTRNVEFRLAPDATGETRLSPCLPVADLAAWGVLVNKHPELGAPDSRCATLSAVPQARSDFQFARQQLLLSFPQSSVSNAARGWVDPVLWDDGIPAALLNYSVSGAHNTSRSSQGSDSDNQYVNLRPGLNLGPWRLRNYTTWTRFSSDGPGGQTTSKWNTIYTYLQRDIKVLRSQLVLGDSTSPAEVFDSMPFRGAQLASDDDMLPESLRGYAPTVRGIARSNAQVTIRQNGYVIYQTYVSPGSFEITDMYPTGGSGDLQVTIRESDGSEQHLVVPYASLPVLQREGRLKYSLTSAAYRSYDSRVDKTPFTQGTAIYGLPGGLTVYGGGQFASSYQSLALGLGKNLGELGAVSVDMTQAWSKQQDREKENGRSFRARYSKNILSTGTNFAIAGYRYATDGFWSLQEVMDSYRESNSAPLQERRRNRAEMTMTQDLGQDLGSLALTAIWEDYWNTQQRLESYGASYSNSWDGISYGLGYTYSLNSSATTQSGGRVYSKDQLFSFNISVPLDRLFNRNSKHPVYANYMLNSSKNGNTTNSLSVGGTALGDNNLSWSVQQGYGSQGQGNSGSVNADWRATYGEVTGGYGYDTFSRRLNYGVQGGVVAHGEGVTFGQPLGETVALVTAPGAKGVSVAGQSGVKTDYRGYAVVPYASPYRKNMITLDTETLGDDTEVALATQTVVPSRGAVVKANYRASVGYRVLMVLTRSNGQTVPFGATVSNLEEKDDQGFIVGDGGQVYLTGLGQHGQLLAKWGNGAGQQCRASYQLSSKAARSGIQNLQAQCL